MPDTQRHTTEEAPLQTMFDPSLATATAQHSRIYKNYEIVHVVADFIAGLTFVLGSIFFFFPPLVFEGDWMFLIGSILFAAKPTIKVLRMMHLARLPVDVPA